MNSGGSLDEEEVGSGGGRVRGRGGGSIVYKPLKLLRSQVSRSKSLRKKKMKEGEGQRDGKLAQVVLHVSALEAECTPEVQFTASCCELLQLQPVGW